MAHLDLLPLDHHGNASMATHVAIRSGDWADPGTWQGGAVPDAGAIVHVPAGIAVGYAGAPSPDLFMVRVDGALNITAPAGQTTYMAVDTIITSEHSRFTVDADGPGDGSVVIDFRESVPQAHQAHFSAGTPGDGVMGRSAWDPEQLSLGLVAAGDVDIRGRETEASLELDYGVPSGTQVLVFDTGGSTAGWGIGDKLVIGATEYMGRLPDGTYMSQDEVRTITDIKVIDGRMVVSLDAPLAYDHMGRVNPETGEMLNGQVGNLQRNVMFASSAADQGHDGIYDDAASWNEGGAHTASDRGHVMFMHNDDVHLSHAGFYGLGRTDKAREIDDFVTGGVHNNRLVMDMGEAGALEEGVDHEIMTPADQIMNQRGRYPVHIHEANMAADHGAHGGHDGGALIEGIAVWGSPGWGIVQHSSHATLKDNVVYDVSGAAYVAEAGDETGRWEGNAAFNSYGKNANLDYEDSADFNENAGSEGIGFYLKSRAIEVVDNVAVSSARAGFFYHNNGVGLATTERDALDPELAGLSHGLDAVDTEDVPIRVFEGNSAIVAENGIRIATDPLDTVRKYNDAWSHFKDFTAWEIDEAGVSLVYTSKYIFEDFLLLGTETKLSDAGQKTSSGFFFKASVADITVVDSHVEGFERAIKAWSQVGDRGEYRRGFWDPKDPADYAHAPAYAGLGAVSGIENPAYNLWNITTVGLTAQNLQKGPYAVAAMYVEGPDGLQKMSSLAKYGAPPEGTTPGVKITLLDDSRAGGLVALWREDLARTADQGRILSSNIPLAYQETVYLSQYWNQDNQQIKRNDFLNHDKGINDDIWSGTILEFAKEDSLGRQVFQYGDFAPTTPGSEVRAVSTNERLIFTKEMIDGVLASEGYVALAGLPGMRFVIMKMPFTDRLTGEIETKSFLVGLDLAWDLPEGAKNIGLPYLPEEVIIAPQYKAFFEGKVQPALATVVFGTPPAEVLASGEPFVLAALDGQGRILLDQTPYHLTGDDQIQFLGVSALVGGQGADFLAGGLNGDRISGGDGNDVLRGDAGTGLFASGSDRLDGGAGDDVLMGAGGRDTFVFRPDGGIDIIAMFDPGQIQHGAGHGAAPTGRDFEPGVDVVELQGFSGISPYNVLDFISDGPGGAAFEAEGTVIRFHGVDADALDADMFHFV